MYGNVIFPWQHERSLYLTNWFYRFLHSDKINSTMDIGYWINMQTYCHSEHLSKNKNCLSNNVNVYGIDTNSL